MVEAAGSCRGGIVGKTGIAVRLFLRSSIGASFHVFSARSRWVGFMESFPLSKPVFRRYLDVSLAFPRDRVGRPLFHVIQDRATRAVDVRVE